MSETYYTEEIAASEHQRKRYADSVSNAVALMRVAAKLRREQLTTPERMASRREEYRDEYAKLLGIDICRDVFGSGVPAASAEPISDDENEAISRVRVTLCDGVDFTGLLLVPKQRAAKAPLAIMSHGGGGSPELCCDLIGPNNYGGVVRKLLDRGVVVFAPQLLLWNMAPSKCGGNIPHFDTVYDRQSSDNELKQCGASIAGFEIYAISRTLDWLCTLDFVDSARIGMLGLSYGGFYTLYTMAYETRIRSGWSAAFFNDRIAYCWRDFVWKDSAGRFLDTEVAGLCAPRRLCVDAGLTDGVFDGSGVAELFPRVERFFTASGAAGSVRLNLWEGGHKFSTNVSDGTTSLDFFLEGMGAYV